MKTKLINLWEALHTSFWFLPALMTFAAIGLSFATIALDWVVQESLLKRVALVWIGGIEGARQLLSTIAGSMITVAGVVFSITIVVLALASSQFGPRLLRNFMRDRGNQVVLGTFIATFTYCLLVLRSIHGGDGTPFVPYISVSLGIALALVSVAVLIYFIHHVSVIIQAPTVIAMVAAELEDGIERLFPEKLGQGGSMPERPHQDQNYLESVHAKTGRCLSYRLSTNHRQRGSHEDSYGERSCDAAELPSRSFYRCGKLPVDGLSPSNVLRNGSPIKSTTCSLSAPTARQSRMWSFASISWLKLRCERYPRASMIPLLPELVSTVLERRSACSRNGKYLPPIVMTATANCG